MRPAGVIAGGLVPEDIAAIDLTGDGIDDGAAVGSFSFTLVTAKTNGQGAFTSPLPDKVTFGGPGPPICPWATSTTTASPTLLWQPVHAVGAA